MGKTSIEWTDASWNPVVGCTEISPGCANCYAARLAATRLQNLSDYAGLATIARADVGENGIVLRSNKLRPRWTGQVRELAERLDQPAAWRKPRRIFVCDMSDLFHKDVPHGYLIQVFRAMAAAPQHTYQILTKRPERMRDFLRSLEVVERHHPMRAEAGIDGVQWPWPNVWCGVSVENQHFADERIPVLLDTPAAVRFLSCEPLLGPVDLRYIGPTGKTFSAIGCRACQDGGATAGNPHTCQDRKPRLDWVIAGGESGPNARPMHPDWTGSLRDQCVSAGMPFFFKQWGEFSPNGQIRDLCARRIISVRVGDLSFDKVGKKKAGRLLDGREWNEFPQVKP